MPVPDHMPPMVLMIQTQDCRDTIADPVITSFADATGARVVCVKPAFAEPGQRYVSLPDQSRQAPDRPAEQPRATSRRSREG